MTGGANSSGRINSAPRKERASLLVVSAGTLRDGSDGIGRAVEYDRRTLAKT